MQLPDIWQVLGTSQVAEITVIVSTVISIVLAQKGQQQQKKMEAIITTLQASNVICLNS
jgi:hypothetical protein